MKTPRNARLTGIWMSIILACSAQAEAVVSNAPAENGFRLDMTALPQEPVHVRLAPPRLMPPASPAAISNALEFSVESFRMDDGTVTARHDGRTPFDASAWKPGMQHPVVPDPGLPDAGTNTLRAVLGQSEEWHVYNAVCGLYLGAPERIPYERTGDTTVLHFPSDWDIRIDNATGAILEPTGLPPLSERELSDLTWAEISRERGVERWMEIISISAASAGKSRRLTGFRLDEIRFVGDKAFVAWRLMDNPPSADGFLRLTYWVDRRTKRIVHSGTEVHEDR